MIQTSNSKNSKNQKDANGATFVTNNNIVQYITFNGEVVSNQQIKNQNMNPGIYSDHQKPAPATGSSSHHQHSKSQQKFIEPTELKKFNKNTYAENNLIAP